MVDASRFRAWTFRGSAPMRPGFGTKHPPGFRNGSPDGRRFWRRQHMASIVGDASRVVYTLAERRLIRPLVGVGEAVWPKGSLVFVRTNPLSLAHTPILTPSALHDTENPAYGQAKTTLCSTPAIESCFAIVGE